VKDCGLKAALIRQGVEVHELFKTVLMISRE